jgi:hypothetical protein
LQPKRRTEVPPCWNREQAQSLAKDARGILDGATADGQRETALKAIREVSR